MNIGFAFIRRALPGLLVSGWLLIGSGLSAGEEGDREVLFYRNPMNPAITSPVPAKDSMGMDYIPVYADEVESGPVVSIDPAIVQNLGVRTQEVTQGRLWRRIDTVGYVAFDETRITHIHMRADGWVEKLKVRAIGERVRAGEILFEIYAPALANAQEEFLQALAVGQRPLIDASRDRLRALGIDDRQIAELERRRMALTRIVVRAPQDGVVTELNAREGMYVTPGTIAMSIVDLESVWIVVDVFERQSDWVEVGQPAEVRLPYKPGEILKGEVEFVYPTLDAKTRTLRVRLRFENPDEALKPDMYANVLIFASPKDNVLSIPREALIRTGKADRVVIAEGDGRFRAVEVVPGMESGDQVEIKSGLQAGMRVVTSGQFLIDSEASIRASAMRMQSASKSDAAGATPNTVTAMGTIEAVDVSSRTLTVKHGLIEALGWPAMTMEMPVADTVDIESTQPGDRIHFTLIQDEDGSYQIGSAQVLDNDTAEPDTQHDNAGNDR